MSAKKVFSTPSVQPKVKTQFSSVSATTTVSILARENILRQECLITNTSSATLYVAFGALPSTTNYAVALTTGATFVTASTDRLNGVWASAGGGQANITEEF